MKHHHTRRALVAAVAVAVAAGATSAARAASHIVDIGWTAEGRFAHRAQIASGKFVEVCGRLKEGEAVRWRFEASAPVDFNIHYHVGRETAYPTKQSQASSGQDQLRVSVSQDHCWMWTNKGAAPISLSVVLER